jgi:hypothetical protein
VGGRLFLKPWVSLINLPLALAAAMAEDGGKAGAVLRERARADAGTGGCGRVGGRGFCAGEVAVGGDGAAGSAGDA